MAVSVKITAFLDVAPCSLVEVDVSEVHTASIIRAMNEATQRCIPEGCHLQGYVALEKHNQTSF
jgi:hypothetical protein